MTKRTNSLVTNRPFYAEGQLVLKNDLNDYDFGVYNEKAISSKSVTKYLNRIYKSESPYIKTHINNLDNSEEINVRGELIKAKGLDGLYDWVVDWDFGKFELGKQLWDWGEDNVSVNISQIMEAEVSNEQQKFKAM
jgi:hypothetical protein